MEMGSEALYQVSLVAAFVAGMVALFAPCCISYLLPAYLGNVFREKKRIFLMTLIYSLGILVVMLPVVLGARALASLFYSLHDQTYMVGGVFMLLVAVLALLGIKLPMIRITNKRDGQTDVFSIFTLGVISGITSSCCAPVLIGVMALSSLTPTTFQALGVGVSYVLGMVAPLYFASFFIDKRNLLEKPIFKKKLTVVNFFKKDYPIFVSNVVAAVIFAVTGGLTIILASGGMLAMPTGESAITKVIQETAMKVTRVTSGAGFDLIFAGLAAWLIIKWLKRLK